jgi:hypothetical protein
MKIILLAFLLITTVITNSTNQKEYSGYYLYVKDSSGINNINFNKELRKEGNK